MTTLLDKKGRILGWKYGNIIDIFVLVCLSILIGTWAGLKRFDKLKSDLSDHMAVVIRNESQDNYNKAVEREVVRLEKAFANKTKDFEIEIAKKDRLVSDRIVLINALINEYKERVNSLVN